MVKELILELRAVGYIPELARHRFVKSAPIKVLFKVYCSK